MKTATPFIVERIESPIGEIVMMTDEEGALRVLDFADYQSRMELLLRRHYGSWQAISAKRNSAAYVAIRAYLAGELGAIEALLTRTAGTSFQRMVWQALRHIPPGHTVAYSELAQNIGLPRASRAVGHANGTNPIAIVVPCHRVIGRSGELTGYGGGIERKRWLIDHERKHRGQE